MASVDVNVRLKERVAFPVGSSALDEEGRSRLEQIARAWRETPGLPPLTVVGAATDEDGSGLAERQQAAAARGHAARAALLAAGVPAADIALRSAAEYAEWHRTTVGGAGSPAALDFSGVVVELFQPNQAPTSCGHCTLRLAGTFVQIEPDPEATDVLQVCSPEGCASATLQWPGACPPELAYASLGNSAVAVRLELRPGRLSMTVSGLRVPSAAADYRISLLRNGRLERSLAGRYVPAAAPPAQGCPSLSLTAGPLSR